MLPLARIAFSLAISMSWADCFGGADYACGLSLPAYLARIALSLAISAFYFWSSIIFFNLAISASLSSIFGGGVVVVFGGVVDTGGEDTFGQTYYNICCDWIFCGVHSYFSIAYV